jgi:hypothetical protein
MDRTRKAEETINFVRYYGPWQNEKPLEKGMREN